MPRYFVTTLGILVVAVTFMSIPIAWKYPCYVFLGVLITVASYYEKRPKKKIVYRVPARRRKDANILGMSVPPPEVQVSVSADSSKVFEAPKATPYREEN
jgi:hypothetical protein